MIKVTLEFANAEDAISALALLRGSKLATDPSLVVPAATKDKTAGKSDGATDKKKSTEPAATGGTPTAEGKKADAPQTQASESSGQAGSMSYDVVGAAITAAAKTHRTETVALLTKFGAKSGKDLKPEQYADFSAQLAEIVKPADDLS